MWDKKFKQSDRKKFLHLIQYIVDAIDSGILKSGELLPTQRDLSKRLNVSIGTITKAFKELEHMGYLSGEIGRGTFVSDITSEYKNFLYTESKTPYKYNLGHFRTSELFNHTIQLNLLSGIKEASSSPDFFYKLNDFNNCGTEHQKQSFIDWIKPLGFGNITTSEATLLMSEVSAVNTIINTFTEAGDNILIEQIGDRITKDQILQSKRTLAPVKIDNLGIDPKDLEEKIKLHQPKILVTQPTFHMPTTMVTSKNRKQEIVKVCERYNIIILEDGRTDKFYDNVVNPYYEMNPEIAIYVTGTYFPLNPALSSSIVVGSNNNIKKIENQFKLYNWTHSQILLEICTNLITSGRADKIVEERKKLLELRNKCFDDVFDIAPNASLKYCPFRWLKLPNSWANAQFAQLAFENGILVRNSDIFLNEDLPQLPYIRISNGAINNDADYEAALLEIKRLFEEQDFSF
ncbi:aminotransferase class I/II-fold pyridoxal phosphate-dependent enzyme [Fulvivirga lutimaris]|uniref:aminotransferase class I/II-fold pyridoxal phosphate-dependent enzyme n=1 Tax=Fulvivirga lutimaris TaxID=1819566 RepID=UPI0012BD6A99|nr:PLP-dependent aminotransferase family protein [Fulvivirga lutimaris]MTI39540.1 PLP-dependent aminotransferase family protein [Fulvivirga lutimaris]